MYSLYTLNILFKIEQIYYNLYYMIYFSCKQAIMLWIMNKKKEENIIWWVIETKPQQEFRAEKNLIQQGFITFCPVFNKELKLGNQFKIKPNPLFKRYLFIQANGFAKKNVYLIRSTKGVSSLLKIHESILFVTSELIHNLKLNQIQNNNLITSHFTEGSSVQIISGIYKGIEAIYQMDKGEDRAIILLSLLHKQTKLNLRKDHLIKL